MKKKKVKKMINKLKKKSERELDAEVSLLHERIDALEKVKVDSVINNEVL